MKRGSTQFWRSVSAASLSPRLVFSAPGLASELEARWSKSCAGTVKRYGNSDSRKPSTKSGQQLELLYYALDWAGPDAVSVTHRMGMLETAARQGEW